MIPQRHQLQVLGRVGFAGQAVEAGASGMVERTAVGRDSSLVERLGCEGCCSYVDSFFSVAGSWMVLVALPQLRVVRAFVVLVTEAPVHS